MASMLNTVTEAIGSTPLVRINRLSIEALILAKLESFNPTCSIKDRIALAMVEAAEQQGKLFPGMRIVEPTSGNTGIGLACISSVRGYALTLVMPESMSIERRKLIALFGAEIVLTPASLGMKGAIEKAQEIEEADPDALILHQFENLANPDIHRRTTAQEILKDTKGNIDIFVAGVGTGGTITGVGEVLKNHNSAIRIVAVEPKESPVLSGGQPGPHHIQGIGAGFVPNVMNRNIIDEIIQVTGNDAIQMARLLATQEGILAGISSGAAMWAARKLSAQQEHRNKTIVVIFPDTGERYLSTKMFDYGE